MGQLVTDVEHELQQRPAVPGRCRELCARGFLPLAIIIPGGAWLRFHAIGDKSLWLDEGCSFGFARLDWHSFVHVLWGGEANMAFYYLLLRAWLHLGDSVTMLRGLSVLFSLGTILVVYLLGRRLFSNGVGLVAAVLLAVNAYSVRYAQEVRSYSLVTLLSATSTLIFTGAVRTGRKRDWFWYTGISVLAVYAHFFAVLVIVAHGASLVLLKTDRGDPMEEGQVLESQDAVRRFWYSAAWIGLCTLPVWAFIAITGPGPIAWNHRIGLATLPDFLLQFSGQASGSLYLPCSSISWTNLLWSPLLLLYVSLAAVGLVRAACLRSATTHERWLQLLPLYWFVLPVVITLTFSLLVQPVFHPRYLNVCLPALVLMVASGVMSLGQTWLRLAALALVCGFGIGGVHAYYSHDFDLCREDFRSASEYVLARAEPGDVVSLHPRTAAYMFDYYARKRHSVRPEVVLPEADLTRGHKRVWVVTSMSLKEGEILARESVSNRHRLAEKRQFKGVWVYLYEDFLPQHRRT